MSSRTQAVLEQERLKLGMTREEFVRMLRAALGASITLREATRQLDRNLRVGSAAVRDLTRLIVERPDRTIYGAGVLRYLVARWPRTAQIERWEPIRKVCERCTDYAEEVFGRGR